MKLNLFCFLSTLIFFKNIYALPHRGQDDFVSELEMHHNSSSLKWDDHANKTHHNSSSVMWEDHHANKTHHNRSRLRWDDNHRHKDNNKSRIKNGPLSVRL